MAKAKISVRFLLLTLIFIAAFSIRLYLIDLLPLYNDEASHYYHYNKIFSFASFNPLTLWDLFNRFIMSYTWLFGISVLGARFGAVLYGSIVVISAYLLANALSPKSNTPIITAVLIAISPWNFMLSRIGHSHILIFLNLICLHCYFYLRSNSKKDVILSSLLAIFSFFYYQSMLIIGPIIISFLVLDSYRRKLIDKQTLRFFLLISLIVIVLVSIKFSVFKITGRGLDLAIWRDPNTIHTINNYRSLAWLSDSSLFTFFLDPRQVAAIFHNKITGSLAVFANNYLSFFSPDWLFFRGDNILRHSTRQMGAFYPIFIPFLLIGTYHFLKSNDKKTKSFVFLWVLLSPVPAALTKDGAGYLLRAVTLLPFLTYFIALGISAVTNFFSSRNSKIAYVISLSILTVYSASYFFFGYFQVYPNQVSTQRSFESGFREISDLQIDNNNATLLIVWDGYYPYLQFHFWQKTPFIEYTNYDFDDIVVGESHFYHPSAKLFFVKPFKTKDVQQFIDTYKPEYLVLPDRYYLNYPYDLVSDDMSPFMIVKYPDGSSNFTIYSL